MSISLPEAQFPSATPPAEEQVSADWQLPYITELVVAVDKVVHWLKSKEAATVQFEYFSKILVNFSINSSGN